MNKEDIKRALCECHKALLYMILYFGGYMLLPQLRELCIAFGLYSSEQAVNRAVRELRNAGILDRQTWVDQNSCLLLAKKFAYRFFSGKSSQEVATPRRPTTMAPYIAQARKIDWLLSIIREKKLTSLKATHLYLQRCHCTTFLSLPQLPAYYARNCALFTQNGEEPFTEQMDRLTVLTAQRGAIARAEPVPENGENTPVTLELAHRRGVYIERIYPEKKAVRLALFAGLSTRPKRVMDWAIDCQNWLTTLLPYYRSILVVYALSDAHRTALRAGLTTPVYGRRTPYYQDRLVAAYLDGTVSIAVKNTDFIAKRCGNIQAIHAF